MAAQRAPRRSHQRPRHLLRVAAASATAAMVLAGCGGGGEEPTEAEGPVDGDDGAVEEEVELVFWSWLPDIQTTVDLFEEAHPNIDVVVENVGVGTDQYTKMQNAIDAGSGGPDVAHMTYDAIANFAITGALADLTQYGGEDIPELFLPGVADLVTFGDAVYGVPQDFGPGVMYYRSDVFEELGLEVPATWDEYAAAAETIKASGADRYITFADPGLADAAYMGLWQLGAEPWTVDGETVTVDLQTDEATRWAEYWTDLNQQDLLLQSTMGADEWFRQMGDGQIATWIVGAWGLQALTGNLPDNAGLWRVAPQPVWEEGEEASSQFGGSATVVLEGSEHKEAATLFALWMNSDPVAVESLKDDQGLLPTTVAAWEDEEFLNEEIEYLGGQQARQIFAESANNTVQGWEWLPFQPYVSSVYQDTVGQAIANKTPISDGLADWEQRIVDYAQEQGFTVE